MPTLQAVEAPPSDHAAAAPTDRLEDVLLRIIASVQVHSPDSFSIAGRMISALQAQPVVPASPTPLIASLQQALYASCFTQSPTEARVPESLSIMPDGDLTPALSEANTSRDRWDGGWQVTH